MIMRRRILKFGAFALGSMLLTRSNSVTAATSKYGIRGQIAPELQVDYWIDENGAPATFKLADYEGKWVFLKCFQSWCPGCHSHGFPALKQISDALAGNQQIVFAGIQTVFEGHSVNTIDKVREIQLQYDLRMPMGHDPGPRGGSSITMVNYRTGGTPWMILISPDREVIFNDFSINAEKAIEFLAGQTS